MAAILTIQEKIRAMLRQASETTHAPEAAAFYAKAHELMAKYNISQDQLGEHHDLVRGSERFNQTVKWVWLLSASAAKLMSCNVLLNEERLCYFAGRASNVEMAEEVFNHYSDQLNKYYRLALPRGLSQSDRATFRRNFKDAAAAVVWDRVCAIVAANARALIVSPVQLEEEWEKLTGCKHNPKNLKNVVIRHNSVGTQAGAIAGHLIELGKEIKQ